MRTQVKDIDDYIAGFPDEVRPILEELRATIRKAAPKAEETIKYGMPTFTLHGNLVYFAAYKNHIGFYPAPRGIEAFQKLAAKYQTGKGTLQFPLGDPVPFTLVTKVVKYRAKENTEKATAKMKKKAKKK